MKPLLSGLKKKDRETAEYKENVIKAEALRVNVLSLIDEYAKLSKERFKK